ncbi:STAS domain-containing protein [Vibrio sp. V27_P1S3P104]|uniref:STAS domain-containing protein n=1 Tax=Vibrio TaxID=662 RepID=UPI000C168614|nr:MULTISPECIES: STAS domain-containing protein [Vibrio]NAW69941.1 STAS domain-containing protein [Vibrio sp. V28_P6S34P95]NAX04660.1 STAS domain-containing protein [Vibrio sp. V30_P3S12P165]NAX33094.1 STAS domain-containing protein [Vibrio sp. V29_P1S30P107]NAX37459.1 STAS domain-containing protein [Vibrio sp. V27_P1S3P104]NAX41815.1 STAS domain-containing protein [Vibrio sp. V26_P1S5P106]
MQVLEENKEQVQIALTGELTIYQADALYEFLTPWAEQSCDVVINVEQVTDIDTSAIQLLLMLDKVKEQQQQRLILLGDSPLLHRVIEKLGVNRMKSQLQVLSSLKQG